MAPNLSLVSDKQKINKINALTEEVKSDGVSQNMKNIPKQHQNRGSQCTLMNFEQKFLN